MRDKYIDERWPLLMIHGRHAITGQPYICDADDSVDILCVSDDHANEMVNHYNKLQQELSDLAKAFDKADPKAFEEFWYNRQKIEG